YKRKLKLPGLLKQGKSAFLFGPRGVGKTVLAQDYLSRSVQHAESIDLLSLDVYRRYVAEPGLFRLEIEQRLRDVPAKETLTVLIDEVQKFPGLLDEVHYLIERHKDQVQFLLTGSSARKLKRSGANLLAGRAWTLRLHPLSSQEFEPDLRKALTIGTLPGIYQETSSSAKRSLKAYVETYLREEVMQESLVRKVDHFIRLLDVAGQVNGEPVNFTAVARDAGVSVRTVQEYFDILVDTLLAFRIDGWSYSVRKQLRQSPKYYFFDCGVLNAVRGELQTELKSSSYRYGKLFETFIVNELIRSNDYNESGYRFHYWRTNTGMEVDLVLTRGPNDSPRAVEIKSQASPKKSDLKGLMAFASENHTANLFCLCQTPRKYTLGSIQVLPWQKGIEILLQG
ncbi:MAG: ATP-binding protein, partial [Nitrospira sp. SB0675_bin_23]|nr:ATP-binding protein [Nitrospira sp. SB0675_bin_23]